MTFFHSTREPVMLVKTLLSLTACCLAALPSSCQGSPGFLLFTDSSQGFIYKANSKGYGLLSPPKVIIHSSFTPQAVTYDSKDQRVYWSSTITEDIPTYMGIYKFTYTAISRAFLNGSSEEMVVRYIQGSVAIAVDSVGRNLYWADNKKGRIEVVKLDGTHRKILIRTTRPTDIALDLTRREMYWSSDGFSEATIERSSMDGSDRQVIVSRVRHDTSTGLCLDTSTRTLFWTLENSQDLFFVSLDNPGGHIYHFQTGSSKPFRMAILDQHLYWTDNQSDSGQIAGVDFTTGDMRVFTSSVRAPRGIYSYNSDVTLSKSNCSTNNGGCSHLCLLDPGQDRVCTCPDKMALKDDGKTCYYDDFLLFISSQQIYFKSLVDLSLSKSHKIQMGLGRGPISTVDFDPVEHKFYWTNPNGEIGRAFLDGSSLEIVVNDSHFRPRAHALDVIGRNIYFLDILNAELGIIVVCQLDGSNQKRLVSMDGKPQAIVLDGKNGLMYWMSHGKNGKRKIERAQMDGKRKEVLVRGIRYFNWGIGNIIYMLALDSSNNRLYWVDRDQRYLCYIETNVKTGKIHTITITEKKRELNGILINGDLMYWSDSARGTADIYRVNKTSPSVGNIQQIVNGTYLPNFYVYSKTADGLQDNNHPCAQFNGWCTHLCLLKPGGYACVCPGYKGLSRPCYTTPVSPTRPPTAAMNNATSANTTGPS